MASGKLKVKNEENKIYVDGDGFLRLHRRDQTDPALTTKTEKKKIKKPENRFKKGGWKYELMKKILKWKSPAVCDEFHFTKLENYLISTDGKERVKAFNQRITKKKLEQFAEKSKDAFILVNCSSNIFVRISLASYLKLCEVQKLCVTVDVDGQDDSQDEFFDMYDDTKVIDNINDLLDFVTYYRHLVEGVMEVQAACAWYTYVRYRVKTVILYRDGSTETLKGDLNEVLQKFDIKPYI